MQLRIPPRKLWTLVAVMAVGACGSSGTVDRAAPAEIVTADPDRAAATPPASEPDVVVTTPTVPDEPPPAVPDEPPSVERRTITVGGMGAQYGPPDRALVNIGATARGATVAEATTRAASAGDAMLAALDAAGVPADDVQTSEFGINPYYDQYDYARISGYEATIGYRVTVADVAELGDVLDRAVAAGGDNVRAWSIGFDADHGDRMAVARTDAWDDVRARAAATADEIGAPLGEVVDVHEKVLVTSPRGMMQGGEGDTASFDIPVSPGVVGVIVLLTVTYEIG